MRAQLPEAEQEVARIASTQHGVVTRAQLLNAGFSRAAIQRRVRKGVLHVQHRGVYRVGHQAPSALARYMAAVLACGPGAALSGLAAAYLLRLITRAPSTIEVTAPTDRRQAYARGDEFRRFDWDD